MPDQLGVRRPRIRQRTPPPATTRRLKIPRLTVRRPAARWRRSGGSRPGGRTPSPGRPTASVRESRPAPVLTSCPSPIHPGLRARSVPSRPTRRLSQTRPAIPPNSGSSARWTRRPANGCGTGLPIRCRTRRRRFRTACGPGGGGRLRAGPSPRSWPGEASRTPGGDPPYPGITPARPRSAVPRHRSGTVGAQPCRPADATHLSSPVQRPRHQRLVRRAAPVRPAGCLGRRPGRREPPRQRPSGAFPPRRKETARLPPDGPSRPDQGPLSRPRRRGSSRPRRREAGGRLGRRAER